jgi:HPt (histidine-containing phosphotransfer) domain-containing protein
VLVAQDVGADGAADVAARRAPRVLPPEAVAGLREAFAGEVGSRLPRLLALLDGPPGPDALRDAHALGSSAVVVGEPDASRTARALEAELSGDAPDRARCAELVRELADRLSSWTAA